MIVAFGLKWAPLPDDGPLCTPGCRWLCDRSERWSRTWPRWIVAPRAFAEHWTLEEVYDDDRCRLIEGPISPGAWPSLEQARAMRLVQAGTLPVDDLLAYVLPLHARRPVRGINVVASADRALPVASLAVTILAEREP